MSDVRVIPKLESFIVKRSTWLRGGESFLRKDGRLCCLGFYCVQAGVEIDDIDGWIMPSEMVNEAEIDHQYEIDALTEFDDEYACARDSHLTDAAVEINDDEDIAESERERRLTQLFAGHGITLTFED